MILFQNPKTFLEQFINSIIYAGGLCTLFCFLSGKTGSLAISQIVTQGLAYTCMQV